MRYFYDCDHPPTAWWLRLWSALRGVTVHVCLGPDVAPEARGVKVIAGAVCLDADGAGFAILTPWAALLTGDCWDGPHDEYDGDPDAPHTITYRVADTTLWGLIADGAHQAHNGTDPEEAATLVMAALDCSEAADGIDDEEEAA